MKAFKIIFKQLKSSTNEVKLMGEGEIVFWRFVPKQEYGRTLNAEKERCNR